MPKRVDVEQRRAALARAAVRVIAERGLEATSLRDVALEAGSSTGMLVHYFADKRSLMIAALEYSTRNLRGRQIAEVHARGDELRVLLEQALPLDEDRVRHWRVTQAFSTLAWNDLELAEIQRREYRGWRRRIASEIAKGVGSGRFRPDLDPERAVDEVIALVDGVAIQALFDGDRWPASKQLDFLSRHLDRLSVQAASASGASL